MNKTTIPETWKRKIQMFYRLLSKKYHVKEEAIANIVCDYADWVDANFPVLYIRKIRNPQPYGKIIEIMTPMKFYWLKDGTYYGAEMGPFFRGLTRYQCRLVEDILDTNRVVMGKSHNAMGDVPPAFKQAFGEKDVKQD